MNVDQNIMQWQSDSPTFDVANALTVLGTKRGVREMRSSIMAFEKAIMGSDGALTADDFNTKHHFSPGVYMRELFIPAGIALTGRIHTGEHMNILSKGKITVWTEDGMKTLTAPAVIRSKALMKRVGYAHEDSIWITVHPNPTNETDIKKVEDRLFCWTFEDAYSKTERTLDDAINALGITFEEMQSASVNESDMIDFPIQPDSIEIKDSPVHGKGMFATKPIARGAVIAPARIGNMRTPAVRFCNHSGHPNAEMIMHANGDVDLVASKTIWPGEEIFNDYYLSFINTRSGENKICQQ